MSRKLKTAICFASLMCAAALIALFVSPALALPVGVLALVIPPAVAARNTGWQNVHTFRVRMTPANAAALNAGVKIGRLPSRALIQFMALHVSTAFNSATTDTIQLGSTNGAVDLLAATTLRTAGYTPLTSAAGLGIFNNNAGTAGETDIWAKYAQSGAAATAGDATLVIGYLPDNDQ